MTMKEIPERLKRSYKDVCVNDLYKLAVSEPAVVRKGETIAKAMEAIIEANTQKVYVVDKKGILVGTITMNELLRSASYRVGARERGVVPFFKFMTGIFKDLVDEIMVRPVPVRKEDKLVEGLRLMVDNHLEDLPVVDDDGRLIGELNSVEVLMLAKNWYAAQSQE